MAKGLSEAEIRDLLYGPGLFSSVSEFAAGSGSESASQIRPSQSTLAADASDSSQLGAPQTTGLGFADGKATDSMSQVPQSQNWLPQPWSHPLTTTASSTSASSHSDQSWNLSSDSGTWSQSPQPQGSQQGGHMHQFSPPYNQPRPPNPKTQSHFFQHNAYPSSFAPRESTSMDGYATEQAIPSGILADSYSPPHNREAWNEQSVLRHSQGYRDNYRSSNVPFTVEYDQIKVPYVPSHFTLPSPPVEGTLRGSQPFFLPPNQSQYQQQQYQRPQYHPQYQPPPHPPPNPSLQYQNQISGLHQQRYIETPPFQTQPQAPNEFEYQAWATPASLPAIVPSSDSQPSFNALYPSPPQQNFYPEHTPSFHSSVSERTISRTKSFPNIGGLGGYLPPQSSTQSFLETERVPLAPPSPIEEPGLSEFRKTLSGYENFEKTTSVANARAYSIQSTGTDNRHVEPTVTSVRFAANVPDQVKVEPTSVSAITSSHAQAFHSHSELSQIRDVPASSIKEAPPKANKLRKVASSRAITSTSIATSATTGTTNATKGSGSGTKKPGKIAEDHIIKCITCDRDIVRISLVGTPEQLKTGWETQFACLNCRGRGVLAGKPSVTEENEEEEEEEEEEVKQIDMDSWKLGRPMQPEEIVAKRSDVDLAPTRAYKSTAGKYRKRNKPGEGETSGEIRCDVCMRELGSGVLAPKDGKSSLEFNVEYVCIRCTSKYMRCSDCGGGGGNRMRAGKWRCKELFENGRKTCILSHSRGVDSNDQEFVIMKTSDIPEEEREQLAEMCGEVFKATLLSGLAIPEILEPGLAMCTTFQEVENMAKDGWQLIEPYIRFDVEKTVNRRRYVATRWKIPTPRKGKKAHLKSIRNQKLINGDDESQSSLRRHKELAGCVLAEWDMLDGSFFVAVTVPWASADVFEQSTSLIREICKRAIEDQEALVSSLESEEERSRYPVLKHVWTMLFFSRDTKVMAYLKNQRNFLTLAEYLKKYKDAKEEYFAPKRDTYIPREFLPGWQVVCKRIDDEWKSIEKEEMIKVKRAARAAVAPPPPLGYDDYDEEE